MVLQGTSRVWGVGFPFVNVNGVIVPPRAVWEFEGDHGEPSYSATFRVVDGAPRCVEFSVRSSADGRGVRTDDLTPVNLLDLATRVFASVILVTDAGATVRDGVTTRIPPRTDQEQALAVAALRKAGAKRGKTVKSERLREAAAIYRRYASDKATEKIAEQMECSPSTAARYIVRARREIDPETGQTFLRPSLGPGKAGEVPEAPPAPQKGKKS